MSFTYEAFYLTGFNTGASNGISGIQAKTPLYWVITGLKYDGNPVTNKDYSWFTGIAIAGSGDLPEQSGYFGFDSENDYYRAVLTIDAASGLIATGCIELYWNSGVSYSQADALTKGFDVFSNFDEAAWNVVTKKNGSVDNADGQHTHAAGGAQQLSDLTGVENVVYTEGYVLRADGDSYDSAQLSHSDLADVGNNDHHIPTAINDTPTDGETTTGVSSNWAYDHLQEFNSVSGDYVATSADYANLSGDYINTSGDYIATSGDFVGVSGDFVSVSGAHADLNTEWNDWGYDITGLSGLTDSVVYIDSNGLAKPLGIGASGLFLMSQGATESPSWSEASGAAGGGVEFVPRTSPGSWDWAIGDVTADNNWHELDISAIVPEGAVAVLIQGAVQNDVGNTYMYLAEKDNTTIPNAIYVHTANIPNHQQTIIKLTDETIEYKISAGMDAIYMVIRGWWI